ncbi:MAG TPA: hypothetical protein VE258_01260, partial [Ktedonobacterales bacterium]|nr:hypothetical protein [Ktedonobacterales bacterium]
MLVAYLPGAGQPSRAPVFVPSMGYRAVLCKRHAPAWAILGRDTPGIGPLLRQGGLPQVPTPDTTSTPATLTLDEVAFPAT